MPKIRRGLVQPIARKYQERLVETFQGLNTTYPYTQLKDSQSPHFYNCRLYARNSSDRRVAIGTRKGPGFYSVPLGEVVDIQQTSTTGAADATVSTTTWQAKKFTNTNAGRLTKVDIRPKEGTMPTQHIMIEIYSDSGGSPGTLLATSSILSSLVTSSYAYISARFIEAPALAAATDYWIVAHMQEGGSGDWLWSSTTNATTAKSSTNSGGSWSATTYDLNAKTYVSTNSKYLGGFRYTPSNATAKTIVAHGTAVYTVSEVDGTTTSIKTGLSPATDYFFDQSNDQLFVVNGVDVPQYWDGTTWAAVGGTPGVSKYLAFHKNRLWFVNLSDPTKLVFSELSDYQTYLSTNFIYAPAPKSGDPIMGITVFQDNLIVFTRTTKYVLYGDDPGNFVLRQSSGKKGAVAQATIKNDPNYVYFLSDDGVYRYNGSSDELMSDSIQTEIDNIEDKTKCAAIVHNNYYKLYYPATGSTVNNACILWDTLNNFWLRDSGTYIDKPFLNEDNELVEGSSVVGAVYHADQAYSDMGKPIDFVYWTKYFGDGLRRIFLRRIIPSIRLQSQPYNLNVYIDIDQLNTVPLQYTINALASGEVWGGGQEWGDGWTFGSATVSTPNTLRGSEGLWHQTRFEQSGVDTPVEILSYLLQFRARRVE